MIEHKNVVKPEGGARPADRRDRAAIVCAV
jgi:hypothetical protein